MTAAIGLGTRQETLELLHGLRELPASFRVVQRALDLIEREDCTNDGLQEILLADPATSAGVIKLANSAYFGVATRVRTAATAVRVVGLRRLETMLRHLVVGKLFELLAAEAPEAERVRITALTAAAAGSKLAGDLVDSDELRLIGLVHNIGELALLSVAPAEYAEAAEAAEAASACGDRHAAARERFGLDFAQVSAQLLEYWRFPPDHVEAVRRLPEPTSGAGAGPRLALYAHVAARLANAWTAAGGNVDSLDERTAAEVGLDATRLEQLRAEVPHAVEEMRAWLL